MPQIDQGGHRPMLLGSVLVPQTVRADPPPTELPRELCAHHRLGHRGFLPRHPAAASTEGVGEVMSVVGRIVMAARGL